MEKKFQCPGVFDIFQDTCFRENGELLTLH